jgi:hypothetical protein
MLRHTIQVGNLSPRPIIGADPGSHDDAFQ